MLKCCTLATAAEAARAGMSLKSREFHIISGSIAKAVAIDRASSRLSSLAIIRRSGLSS
jgi:hypothetical protein